jgi:hypothetical protein
MATNPKKTKEIETFPDAWERFERAVDVVAKSPPQHRISKSNKKTSKPGLKKQRSNPSQDPG